MNSKRPLLSLIVPWCDRPEIATTYRHNGPAIAANHAEIIISNCGGNSELLHHAFEESGQPAPKSVTISRTPFNKSLALNIGAWLARGQWFLFLDADILLSDAFLSEIQAAFHPGIFLTVARVLETARGGKRQYSEISDVISSVELVGRNGTRTRVNTNHLRIADGSRSGPGLVCVTRSDFVTVGGMNSHLEGWGWEDIDLLARLQLGLGLERRETGTVTHLTHGHVGPEMSRLTPQFTQARNFAECLANYALGNVQGTYSADVRAWRVRATIDRAQ